MKGRQRYVVIALIFAGTQSACDQGTLQKTPMSPEFRSLDVALEAYASGDFTKAFNLFERAAGQSDRQAQHYLGTMYESGRGVDKDARQAARWYEAAASGEYVPAQYKLGWLYAYGRGLEKSQSQAVDWWQKAADGGQREAQRMLAYLYRTGSGVEKDLDHALSWLARAAQGGDVRAQVDLASLYEGKEDDYQAVLWYEKAASAGNVIAQTRLASYLAQGRGIEKDVVRALQLYEAAAQRGYLPAQKALDVARTTSE